MQLQGPPLGPEHVPPVRSHFPCFERHSPVSLSTMQSLTFLPAASNGSLLFIGTHSPFTQGTPGPQGGMHRFGGGIQTPATQCSVGLHAGQHSYSAMHRPLAQRCPSGQRGLHRRLQTPAMHSSSGPQPWPLLQSLLHLLVAASQMRPERQLYAPHSLGCVDAGLHAESCRVPGRHKPSCQHSKPHGQSAFPRQKPVVGGGSFSGSNSQHPLLQ